MSIFRYRCQPGQPSSTEHDTVPYLSDEGLLVVVRGKYTVKLDAQRFYLLHNLLICIGTGHVGQDHLVIAFPVLHLKCGNPTPDTYEYLMQPVGSYY